MERIYAGWRIEGNKIPSLCSIKGEKGEHILHAVNTEWGDWAWDINVTLSSLVGHPEVALISAVDGRGTTDGSPAYRKFLAYSFI